MSRPAYFGLQISNDGHFLPLYRGLVNVHRNRLLAANTGLHNSVMADRHNPIMAATALRCLDAEHLTAQDAIH